MLNTLDKEIQNTDIENKILSILPEVIDTLSPYADKFTYTLRNIHPTNMIRNMHMKLFDLPEGVTLWNAYLRRTKNDSNHGTGYDIDFMVYNNMIVPLGTHVSPNKNEFCVYPLQPGKDKISINDFIVDKLPENTTVFRVLSEEEAKKFSENNITDIGSIHQIFWDKSIYTSIHNISSEFIQKDNYNRV